MLKQLIKKLREIKRPEISLDDDLDKGKVRIKKDKKVALMFSWRF